MLFGRCCRTRRTRLLATRIGERSSAVTLPHCQAWNSREELLRKWGVAGYLGNIRKIIAAVEETDGFVVTYNGSLIDAVYHSCCGGMTEDAADVWGRRIPYLVAVSCGCQRKALELGEMKTWERAELLAALGLGGMSLPAIASGVQVVARTATARASMVSVYGITVAAAELRKALSLSLRVLQLCLIRGA